MERVALITGCSSGVGRATAEAFRQEEWSVVATARNESDLETLRERGCQTASLNVRDDDEVDQVVEETIDAWGRLDCLVNNAGFSQVGPVEDVSVDRVHQQFDVNVYGPHRLTRAVLPHMRERGDGTIVNVSSALGRLALPGTGVYAGSKFALEAMSDALRAEVSPLGIDVVLIEPGYVATSFRERASNELAALTRTEAYEGLYRLLDDWEAADGFGPTSLEAMDVADAIVNAASATQPDPRYVVGSTGRFATLAGYLPGSLRDAVYRMILRATSLRSGR